MYPIIAPVDNALGTIRLVCLGYTACRELTCDRLLWISAVEPYALYTRGVARLPVFQVLRSRVSIRVGGNIYDAHQDTLLVDTSLGGNLCFRFSYYEVERERMRT